ncbi:MAG: signal peptide peptidase SppA [Bacteroidota bacterium]|nr:signal peptide peptidase SppA [Bacteroidota bacterium]
MAVTIMRFLSTLLASALGALIAFAVLLVFVGLIFSAVVASVGNLGTAGEPAITSNSVLMMDLSGPILEQTAGDDPFQVLFDVPTPTSLHDIKRALTNAAEDDRIAAVWLRPGGVMAGWATLADVRQALVDFKSSGKPLIASENDLGMGEAAYYLASAADSIFSTPEPFFEFNGFYLGVSFYKGLIDKLNIEPTVIRAGQFKGAVEPYTRRNLSQENRMQLEVILANRYDAFVHTVAESRDLSADAVESLMSTGALITARDAHEAGLIDNLLHDDEVRSQLESMVGESDDLNTVSLRRYSRVSVTPAPTSTDEVAVVYAVGTIMGGSSSTYSQTLGATTFARAMKRARENDRVKAVVLRINSPGGMVTASDEMWRAVHLTAGEKPVIVSMGNVAASGGYWLATAADTIMVSPHTITGSIGVFGIHFSLGRMMDTKLGITTDRITTGPFADMFSGMTPLEPREQALLERAIDQTYAEFLTKVSVSRNMPLDEVDAIAQGRVWTGADALDIGLADIEGGLDDAIALAAERGGLEEGTYRVIRLPRPKSFLEEFTDSFMIRARTLFDSPWDTALREQARLLEELSQMQRAPLARLPWDISVR